MKPKPSPIPLRTLIVAAYAPELSGLAKLGRRHFVIKNNIAYLAAGIGPVAAAFGLTHFLEDYRPQSIIGIGTAGIIHPKKFSIGDIVCARSVTTAAATAGTYAPRLQKSRLILSPPKFQSAHVYCPQEITTSEFRRAALAQAGHDIENLEAFALAFVANKFRIPCEILLGLTNHIGPNAHAEWRRHAVKVQRDLVDSIKHLSKI